VEAAQTPGVETGAEAEARAGKGLQKLASLLVLWELLAMRITRTETAVALPAEHDVSVDFKPLTKASILIKTQATMMSTASRILLTSMPKITRLRHTALSAMISPKLHTLAATTSLLLQSIRMLISRRVPITHTHSTTLQTTLRRARTRLTSRLEVHTGKATLL
jgi:hypothetical protein